MYVYAIKSTVKDWVYVGMSNDVNRRLSEHNRGKEPSTKALAPFMLIYQEEVLDRKSARIREKYLKSSAGRRFLKRFRYEEEE